MDDDLSHHAGRPRPLSSLILPAELERFEHDRPDDGDDDRPQSPRVQASPAGYMPPRLSHLHPPLPQQQQQHPHSPLVCFGRALQKAALQGGITDSHDGNLTVAQFLRQWFLHWRTASGPVPAYLRIAGEAVDMPGWIDQADRSGQASVATRGPKSGRKDLRNRRQGADESEDIQRIPWSKLGVRRADARVVRDGSYLPYRNLEAPNRWPLSSNFFPSTENFYRPKAHYPSFIATDGFFQMRNLLSATTANTVQYAAGSIIYSATPFYGVRHAILDLSDLQQWPRFERRSSAVSSVRISTMKAVRGVTVAGGMNGEYAIRATTDSLSHYTDHDHDFCTHTNPIITHNGLAAQYPDARSIITHTDLAPYPGSRSQVSRAVIASNDGVVRTFDTATGAPVTSHRFARTVNCTATTPDGRLRCVVGDAREGWVVDAESGLPVRRLELAGDGGGNGCARRNAAGDAGRGIKYNIIPLPGFNGNPSSASTETNRYSSNYSRSYSHTHDQSHLHYYTYPYHQGYSSCASRHPDFAFSCAWSPPAHLLATTNQDTTATVWDTRMWRPLAVLTSDVAGYRSVRFSPSGWGGYGRHSDDRQSSTPLLLLAEPADRVVLVNVNTFATRQVVDFFGEVGGADFTPDMGGWGAGGERVWVANMDPDVGGLMEMERVRAGGTLFGELVDW